MSAFDELTLGDVEDIQKECLDGKPFADADPLRLAGAVMWMTGRKNGHAGQSWDDFKYQTKMADIRRFSETEMVEPADPTTAPESQMS